MCTCWALLVLNDLLGYLHMSMMDSPCQDESLACFKMMHDTARGGLKSCVSCLQVADMQRSRDAAQSEAAERGQLLAQQQQDMALLQVQSCAGLHVLKCLSRGI